jgi:transcriptional regulator with XRE-family HTH domain
MKTIGEKIRDCRKAKKVDQVELAKKLGISPATISRYEQDVINVPFRALERIASALDVSVSHLTDGL